MLKLMLKFVLTFLVISVSPKTALGATPDWTNFAISFTGQSELVRSQAIQSLHRYPDLESTLKTELTGKNKFLALDVISTLKLKSLLPDLIQLSEKDESGYFYHTINSLMTSENRQTIIDLYSARVSDSNTSTAAKVSLLDSLGRLKVFLKVTEVEALLKKGEYEVRSAALYYIRYCVLKLDDLDYLPLTQLALKNNPYQIKLQALYFISELSHRLKRKTQSYLKICEADSNPEIRDFCLRLAGESK